MIEAAGTGYGIHERFDFSRSFSTVTLIQACSVGGSLCEHIARAPVSRTVLRFAMG